MTLIVVLMYYFMIGSLLGMVAALRSRYKAKAWAEYAYKKNPGFYSQGELESLYSLITTVAFLLAWPMLLWAFVKIMFGMRMKWEKENAKS